MPSVRRRAILGIVATSGVAGCVDRLRGDDDADTSPADRRVPATYGPGASEWIRSTRSFSNDVVSPMAEPPRHEPDERWNAGEVGGVLGIAVVDDVVFAGARDGVDARRLEDGDLLWERDADSADVTVVDGRCYVVDDGGIVARDAETGSEIWRHEPDDPVGSLVEIDGTVYYTARGDLHGLHADTGDRRWTVDGEGVYGSLAIADRELHWVTMDAYRVLEPDGPNRPDERATVPFDGLEPRTRPAGPAVVDGTIALGGWSDGPGPAPVRSLTRRGTVWQRPFEPAVGTPAILEDRLLATGYDNGADALDESTVAALEPDTGDPIWETTVHEPVGPPAVADGVIYTGGGHPSEPAGETGHLFALEVETGDVLWTIETDGAFASHPLALVEDVVVIGTRTGVVVLE